MTHPGWLLAVAALLSWALGWPVYALLARLGIVDRPNERSSHTRPTVRGGGLAIMATIFLLGGGLAWQAHAGVLGLLLVTAALLAAVSFLDDMRQISPGLRFGVHLLAAAAALSALGIKGWELAIQPSAGLALPVLAAGGLGLAWLVGYANAFNFMDGINGLAAGQAVLTGLGLALVAGSATGAWGAPPILFAGVLAGAAAGFLPHNFPRARMFMGDVSSAPLGFLLAAATLWLAHDLGAWLLVPLALLHVNFVLDTAIALLCRAARGEKLYEAHREHFYQKLVRAGWSHARVTGWEMSLQAVTVILLVLAMRTQGNGRLALCLAVPVLWGLFYIRAEQLFRRSLRSCESTQTKV